MADEIIGSIECQSDRASTISAYWPTHGSQLPQTINEISFGQVQYFIKHIIKVGGEEVEHTFAYIKWYEKHICSDYFGSNAIVCQKHHAPHSVFSYMPVQRIFSICAKGQLKMAIQNNLLEDIIVIIPIHTTVPKD